MSFDTEALAQADASDRATTLFTLSVCENCQKMHSEESLVEIKNFDQRVAAGEIVPSGECPDCGSLCHLYKLDEPVDQATGSDFDCTLGAIEGYLSSKADHGDSLAAGLVAMLKPWLPVRRVAMSLTDSGVSYEVFATEELRIRHFAKVNAAFDDHYFIDVRGVIVDVGLATVGPEALEDL